MGANATVIGVLTVRAIREDELDWFVGLDPDAPGFEATIRELWASGDGAPDWTLVAERDAQPVGRVALYTEPLGCGLPIREGRLAGLWLDWSDGNHLAVARELLDAVTRLASGRTPFVERRLNPEVHADLDRWGEVLEESGFDLFQEKRGFTWTDPGGDLPLARLRYRSLSEVGRVAYAEAMGEAIQGTLDRNDRFYLDACGPAGWGRQMVQFAEPDDEAGWLLAYEDDGALAGYVAVGPFEEGLGTIVHIGVVPDRRGQGYVDDLLRAAARAARGQGFSRMLSDVDTLNAPMLAAMGRNGHLPGVRPWHVWAYRRAVEPAHTR